MKTRSFVFLLLAVLLITSSGCAVVGGIFKAGVGVGIFIVVVIVALVLYLMSKIGKNK